MGNYSILKDFGKKPYELTTVYKMIVNEMQIPFIDFHKYLEFYNNPNYKFADQSEAEAINKQPDYKFTD